MTEQVLHLDFETKSTVNLPKCGVDVYAKHPSTDIMCMGYALGEGPVQLWKNDHFLDPEIEDLIEAGVTVVAHNAPFELAIWNNVGVRRYGWPELKPEQTVCTMAMAYAMALPGSLEKAAAAVGISKQKDMAGSRVMLQLSQPREIKPDGTVIWWDDAAKFQRLYDYCKQDIEVERELHKRILELSPSEREMWLLDYRINQRGISIDKPAVMAAIQMVEIEKERLDIEMRKVTQNQVATCTATAQLKNWLISRGLALKGVAKADVANLLEDPTIPPDCRSALLLRQEAAKSSTAKLEALALSASSDGRIRGIFQYHGASTGRWAGRRIQPHNFPRPKIKQAEIETVLEILGRVS